MEMSAQAYKEIYDKYFKAFEVVAEIHAGIKHGAITNVGQVKEMLDPLMPSSRGRV